ncbi:MAG: phospholipase D-like domain-containing protein [Marmoricola sp.]
MTLVGAANATATAAPTGKSAAVVSAADPAPDPDAGKPPANKTITEGDYFSYPNRSFSYAVAIRNRVLNTINSTWGEYVAVPDDPATPLVDETELAHGTIRMSTWSFNDSTIAHALHAARNRGASVQIVAAESVNNEMHYKAWSDIKRVLNTSQTDDDFARECRGACRGTGGTPHSKVFLFDDVGSRHRHNVVVQTSMNLTRKAYRGQWNSATVMWNEPVYGDFLDIFNQSAARGSAGTGYRKWTHGGVTDIFFPGGTASNDPVLDALDHVHCTGVTAGGIRGRTRIRIIQYALYDTRGNAIAKKLRGLWNNGCNVAIIYSVTSLPVLKILRSHSGRGAVPMRQSVTKDRHGTIVDYNHSKWMAISGNYSGVSHGAYMVLAGSANWSDFAYHCDEQMQQIFGRSWVAPFFHTFDTTWRQRTSRPPSSGRTTDGGRMMENIPEQPTFGEGIYANLSEDG